ncbi:hypothetical protein BH11BAC1_BH11BAC1_20930 [soil metagenome]
MKKFWFVKIIILVPLGIAAVTFVTMSLWNWLVPVLFTGPIISFWQTLGLLILSKILFGGFHGKRGGPGGHMRDRWRSRMEEKMKHMTPEQREELRKKWQQRCGPKWNFPEENKTENPA